LEDELLEELEGLRPATMRRRMQPPSDCSEYLDTFQDPPIPCPHDTSCVPPVVDLRARLPDPNDWRKHVKVVRSWWARQYVDEIDKEAVRVAWGMLGENVDLVNWALCRVGVGGETRSDYVDALFREWPFRTKVRFQWFPAGYGAATYNPRRCEIIINIRYPEAPSWWQIHVPDYKQGGPARRTCFTIKAAALLAHELGECFGIESCLWGTGCVPCDTIRQYQNALTWALTQRYWAVGGLDSGCYEDFRFCHVVSPLQFDWD